MQDQSRRLHLLDRWFELSILRDVELRGWVVLPNHYHLLVHTADFQSQGGIFRLIHGEAAHQGNQEDGRQGRQVWYRYTDRAIQSERHYYTTLNYVHYNPLKHEWATSPYDWPETSVHWYLAHFGREWLRDLWAGYPVREYGRDWDESSHED